MSIYFKTLSTLLLLLVSTWLGDSVLNAQCPMVCRQDFTVSLGSNGQAQLDAEIVLDSSTEGCNDGFSITILDVVSEFDYGSIATADMIGLPLLFEVTDNATGNNCSGNLTVVDNTPPQIFADTVYTNCNTDIAPNILGFPGASDNVTAYENLTWDWVDQFIDYDCFYAVNGTAVTAEIFRTWYVTDENGNIRSKEQSIFLLRNVISDVEWPVNLDDFGAPSLTCNVENVNDLTITGEPSINGIVISNQGNCDLLTSYTDQTTVVCGGETKVFRNWAVYDYCSNESENYIQLIRIKDIVSPTINCPADISVGTDNGLCSGTVVLENATGSDNCSDFSISHSWDFGENETIYSDIPVGMHFLRYTAVDECGNESYCDIQVTVEDDDEPTPVCKEHTFISLSDEGTNEVSAELFNESSLDNCQVDHFEVSKNGIDFSENIVFDCADVLVSPISIILRVIDTKGLRNDCAVEVTIEDYLVPSIVCPLDLTIDCHDDINELNVSGLSSVEDNCGIENVFHSDDNSNLNDCGFGTVLRLWEVEDANGNSSFCVQEITIGDATPTGVIFPSDFVTYNCGVVLNPETTGTPQFTGVDCEQMLLFYEDDTITVTDACVHLVRNWSVYDLCTFDPNNAESGGEWTYSQALKIYDNEMPELNVPADITVFISGNDCVAEVVFPDATASDCSLNVSVTNNSLFANSNFENASGSYPYGFYYITFTARDECDNIVNGSTLLTVLDAEIPVIECNGDFTVNLGSDGTITIPAENFDAGSYDNCSENLTYHIYPSTFNCADRGVTDVLFQVRDESLNEASCWTTVIIQDNNNVCSNSTIKGRISNEEGEDIGGKYVGLSGGISMAVSTNSDGTFEFPDLPSGEFYTLTPTYNQGFTNGVTTSDILDIRKHILGVKGFNTPYQMIAADANNSGSITTSDILELRKLILGITEEFPNNDSWRFVDNNYEFSNPLNPFSDNFPEEIVIPVLNQNYLENDFIAIKIGDVNGTANLIDNQGEERNRIANGNLFLSIENKKIEAGYKYEIPLKAKDFKNIKGLQFGLNFDLDYLVFDELIIQDLPETNLNHFGLTKVDEGEINFSWDTHFDFDLEDNVPLFTLKFTAKKDAYLEDVLGLRLNGIKAEAYQEELRNTEEANLLDVALFFEETEQQGIQIFQNYPNPCAGETTIRFYLPKATEVTLTVFDIEGNPLWQESEDLGQGYKEIQVDLEDKVKGSAILYYQIQAKGFRPVGATIVVAE